MASDSTGEAVARVLTSSASGRPRKAGTERDLKSHLRRFVTGLYFCLKRVGAGPGVFSSKVSDFEAMAKETTQFPGRSSMAKSQEFPNALVKPALLSWHPCDLRQGFSQATAAPLFS